MPEAAVLLDQGDSSGRPFFRPFPKIPRLRRSVVITEKIDGTHSAVVVTEDGNVYAQGRKRFHDLKDDNHGWAAWVLEHEDELRGLGPGVHYGEWWGHRINRGYGLDHKRFSLFNVKRWTTGNVLDEDRQKEVPPPCCHVVPVLAVFNEFDTGHINGVLESLRDMGSRAAPGFKDPEGIVVLHEASGQRFKRTLEGDDVPKGSH